MTEAWPGSLPSPTRQQGVLEQGTTQIPVPSARTSGVRVQLIIPQMPSTAEILLNKKPFVENTLASAIKLFVRNIKNAGKIFP